MAPPTVENLLDLPNELLMKILSYLAENERKYGHTGSCYLTVHPTSLRLVCKKFNQIISEMKNLQNFFMWSDTTDNVIETLTGMSASWHAIRSLELTIDTREKGRHNWPDLFATVRNLRGLRSLKFRHLLGSFSFFSTEELFLAETHFEDEFIRTLERFPKLKTVLYECKTPIERQIDISHPLNRKHIHFLKRIAETCRKLDAVSCLDLKNGCMYKAIGIVLKEAPTTVESLNLSCHYMPFDSLQQPLENPELLHQRFTNLKGLEINLVPGLWQHLVQIRQLENLQLSGLCSKHKFLEEETELRELKFPIAKLKLRRLEFVWMTTDISAPGYLKLYKHCPELKELTTMHRHNPTYIKDMGGLLKTLSQFCPQLESFHITGQLIINEMEDQTESWTLPNVKCLSLSHQRYPDWDSFKMLHVTKAIFRACHNVEQLNWEKPDPSIVIRDWLPKVKIDLSTINEDPHNRETDSCD